MHTHTQALVCRSSCTHTHTQAQCPTCWDVVERRCLQNLQRLLLSQDPLCGRESTFRFKYGPQHWDEFPATNLLIRQLRPQSERTGFRSSAKQRAHAAAPLPPPERPPGPWPAKARKLFTCRDARLQRCSNISSKSEGYREGAAFNSSCVRVQCARGGMLGLDWYCLCSA